MTDYSAECRDIRNAPVGSNGEPSNTTRADRAALLARFYETELLGDSAGEDTTSNFAGIMADMRHWCHAHGQDFDTLAEWSTNLFDEEKDHG